MKLGVLGAGAIGSMLGGLIQHHRPDIQVVLLVRGAHGAAILEQGFVRLEGPWGRYEVPVAASTDVRALEGCQVVLVTVKSQATPSAMEGAKPYLDEALVISIQNGINDEILRRYVNAERLVMGMTATNMAVLQPGSVSLQLDGATLVGAHSDGSNQAAAAEATRLLKSSGMEIHRHDDILGVRYNKLVMNVIGYASCISASNFITEALAYQPWRQQVALPLVEECVRTFQQAGIRLAKIPGRPGLANLRRLLRLMDAPLAGWLVELGARRIYNKKPIVFSLYQDLLRGKATEVDYINGQIVRLARSCGSDAPCNGLVVQMVHELEERGAGSFYDREQVISRFRQLSG